ncbi:hypothetical protein [Prevotella sp.]|uniref:hypothetical protein n=1 Tax=Prevotella sp. TaxID=59823 RepID=UPI0027E24649|nr:hypothetical protein [Prevotella sp.]
MNDLEQMAIDRLKAASEMSLAAYQQPLVICISGGKDSGVITELAVRSGIPCEFQHNHTTADAPETVRFVRSEFKRLEEKGYKQRYVPVCVKTEYVDGEKIKADTPYMLKNGEFVEAKSDGE